VLRNGGFQALEQALVPRCGLVYKSARRMNSRPPSTIMTAYHYFCVVVVLSLSLQEVAKAMPYNPPVTEHLERPYSADELGVWQLLRNLYHSSYQQHARLLESLEPLPCNATCEAGVLAAVSASLEEEIAFVGGNLGNGRALLNATSTDDDESLADGVLWCDGVSDLGVLGAIAAAGNLSLVQSASTNGVSAAAGANFSWSLAQRLLRRCPPANMEVAGNCVSPLQDRCGAILSPLEKVAGALAMDEECGFAADVVSRRAWNETEALDRLCFSRCASIVNETLALPVFHSQVFKDMGAGTCLQHAADFAGLSLLCSVPGQTTCPQLVAAVFSARSNAFSWDIEGRCIAPPQVVDYSMWSKEVGAHNRQALLEATCASCAPPMRTLLRKRLPSLADGNDATAQTLSYICGQEPDGNYCGRDDNILLQKHTPLKACPSAKCESSFSAAAFDEYALNGVSGVCTSCGLRRAVFLTASVKEEVARRFRVLQEVASRMGSTLPHVEALLVAAQVDNSSESNGTVAMVSRTFASIQERTTQEYAFLKDGVYSVAALDALVLSGGGCAVEGGTTCVEHFANAVVQSSQEVEWDVLETFSGCYIAFLVSAETIGVDTSVLAEVLMMVQTGRRSLSLCEPKCAESQQALFSPERGICNFFIFSANLRILSSNTQWTYRFVQLEQEFSELGFLKENITYLNGTSSVFLPSVTSELTLSGTTRLMELLALILMFMEDHLIQVQQTFMQLGCILPYPPWVVLEPDVVASIDLIFPNMRYRSCFQNATFVEEFSSVVLTAIRGAVLFTHARVRHVGPHPAGVNLGIEAYGWDELSVRHHLHLVQEGIAHGSLEFSAVRSLLEKEAETAQQSPYEDDRLGWVSVFTAAPEQGEGPPNIEVVTMAKTTWYTVCGGLACASLLLLVWFYHVRRRKRASLVIPEQSGALDAPAGMGKKAEVP